MEPNKRFYKTPNTASIVFVLILTAMVVSTTFHIHSVEAADFGMPPNVGVTFMPDGSVIMQANQESTAEPNSPVSASPDEFIGVECVVYEVEASVLHDLVGKNSDEPTTPAVTRNQILIGKITTSSKSSELVRWGDSPKVLRLGKACTFALTTHYGYPTNYTINSTSGKNLKPLSKQAHTGLELQLTATKIQDSDMILIAIETKSKKLHFDFAKDAQGQSTEIPVIGGSFANAEVTAKFGQSILLSGLPVGGLASHETSDRCLVFVITPQRRDVSQQDDQSLASALSKKPVTPLDNLSAIAQTK